uniref:Uncharacterized protein n=1 Tax=Timema cristinae TaxID=61476 RepID=A0A7R9CW64_TIMCR|nr:unnamed protein product [Timema cristinae]
MHRKTSAEQNRGHVTISKPITRFLPHRREMFGMGKLIKSQPQPSQMSGHAHLATYVLYSQKLGDNYVGRIEEIRNNPCKEKKIKAKKARVKEEEMTTSPKKKKKQEEEQEVWKWFV